MLRISGLNNDEIVELYTVDGRKLNSKRATDSSAIFNAKKGEVVIVRIEDSSMKIIVK